ncbi:hypothetical protein BGZ60DRAFT_8919 [Tricladium varicosporioides]|nr:hypothetical protein BGZ60DRAFT_8919 [Hymenoscyphus varicosporioides]
MGMGRFAQIRTDSHRFMATALAFASLCSACRSVGCIDPISDRILGLGSKAIPAACGPDELLPAHHPSYMHSPSTACLLHSLLRSSFICSHPRHLLKLHNRSLNLQQQS